MIISLHTVAMVHATDLMLKTWNMTRSSSDLFIEMPASQRATPDISPSQFNSHRVRGGWGARWCRLSHEVASVTPEEKIVDLKPQCSELREFILHLRLGATLENVNRLMFMLELDFNSHTKSCRIS